MSEQLFTRNFVLVCVASLRHNTSFPLLLATLPLIGVKALRPSIWVLGMSFATGSILSFVPFMADLKVCLIPGSFLRFMPW